MLRPLAVNDKVSLIFEEPQDVPLLFTDESKVSQILRNFLSNALKFTERGSITVRARRISPDAVALAVADTGIGIAPEFHGRIFQEFGQVDSPLQKKVRGTGLGLPLSMRLAQLLGGTINLESTPGVGSTFTLVIPITYHQSEDRTVQATPAAEAPPRRRVLVIDDDEASRYLVRRWLPGDTFEIVEQGSSPAAIATVRAVLPDVIVLDLMMPDLSGFDVFEQLQADEQTRKIPVVVYTSMNEANARARLGRKGVDVVSKSQPAPAAASALRAAVTRAVQPVNT
jgi:CheY-like chemotaxis protein/anti-sigma regulatory factor (Ser/Thr protein kinase)